MGTPDERAASALSLSRKLTLKGILALIALALVAGIAVSIAATPVILWARFLNSL